MTVTGSRKPTRIGSVEKALAILDLLVERRAPAGVTEISRTLGFTFSTTHHLISTLRASGYLDQDPATRKYRLGLGALRLGLVAPDFFDLHSRAGPVLQELALEVNESANLAIFDHLEVVYIQQASSSRPSRMFTRLGARAPLYCTGVGKAFLASLSPAEARARFEASRPTRFTGSTVVDWPSLKAELEHIRQLGYALDREEREEGVACVAAQVRDASGKVCAAMSVSGPAGRILPRAAELAAGVMAAAGRLSSGLGYRPGEPREGWAGPPALGT
ncbi:MAG: IclR family transcriptional regulator [Bacillota bacterium]